LEGDKTKIVSILKNARPKGETDSPYFRIKLVLTALIALIILEGIFIIYTIQSKKTMEASYLAQIEEMKELQTKLDSHVTEVIAYKDKLHIKSLRIRNTDNVLKISGYIQNTGKREVNDIILTIYFLDDDDLPIDTRYHTASSSDGSPLKRYQRRKFSLSIEDAPDTAKEIQVIVSDIEFQE
jgi:hypothetical protein